MAYADGIQPSPPDTYPIYLGFYVIPSDDITQINDLVRIDFFKSTSTDGVNFGQPQFLGYGEGETGFYTIDTELSTLAYNNYYCVYVFGDGSKSPYSEAAEAGQAQLTPSTSLNVDKLASEAYITGLITSGIFRGVIFETSAKDPKVRMDPTGIFATTSTSTPVFYLYSDGVTVPYFSGKLLAKGIEITANGVGDAFDTNSGLQWLSPVDNSTDAAIFAIDTIATGDTGNVLNIYSTNFVSVYSGSAVTSDANIYLEANSGFYFGTLLTTTSYTAATTFFGNTGEDTSGNGIQAQISTDVDGTANLARITLQLQYGADTFYPLLADYAGNSDFARSGQGSTSQNQAGGGWSGTFGTTTFAALYGITVTVLSNEAYITYHWTFSCYSPTTTGSLMQGAINFNGAGWASVGRFYWNDAGVHTQFSFDSQAYVTAPGTYQAYLGVYNFSGSITFDSNDGGSAFALVTQ